jgi:hypothetical protein
MMHCMAVVGGTASRDCGIFRLRVVKVASALTCARDQPTPRPLMAIRAVPATTRRIATVAIDRPLMGQARAVQVVCVVFSDQSRLASQSRQTCKTFKVTECALIWMHRVAYSSNRSESVGCAAAMCHGKRSNAVMAVQCKPLPLTDVGHEVHGGI